MKYYLTFKDDKSDKFWQIEIEGNSHTVTYGKTGTNGTSKTKTFDSEEECLKSAEKLKSQKMKKGYTDAEGADNKAEETAPITKKEEKPVNETKAEVSEIKVETPVENVISETNPEAVIDIINQFIEKNELMQALDYCSHLKSLSLTDEQKTQAIFVEGRLAYIMNDYAKAEEKLLQAGEQAYYLLAKIYHSKNKYSSAYEYYDKAGTFESYWDAGMLGKTQDFTIARDFFLKALDIAEKENRLELWDCYLKLGAIHHTTDTDKAEEYYLKSMETGNANAAMYSNLAILYLGIHGADKAHEILDKAIEKHPKDSLAYFNKSCIYAQQDKQDEAMAELEKAFYHGYKNFRQIKEDTDFDNLRERDDFKELVQNYDNYYYDLDDKDFSKHPERLHKVRIYSYTRLKDKKIPEFLFKAHNSTTFHVDDHPIKEIPTEMFQLPKLEEWSFIDTSIKDVPDEALDRPFKYVGIELKRITAFPHKLERLQGLKKLYLSSVKFSEVPKEISHLKQLEDIRIKHSKITSIDREIGSLSNLTDLEIRDTALKELPKEIANLNSLRVLSLSDNPDLHYFPEEILLLPELVRVNLYKNGFPSTEANKLLEHGLDNDVDRKTLALQMAVLQNDKSYITKNGTIKQMLPALNSSVALLRENVLTYISEQQLEIPLSENSEVFVIGKFDNTVTEVKKQLTELGITVAKKATASTTHILIGQKPGKKLDDIIDLPVEWITERQLASGNKSENNTQEAAELTETRTKQIKMLLASPEVTNLEMALEVIEETNTGDLFAVELFLAYQFTSEAPLRKRILALIKGGQNKAVQTAILKKYGFTSAAEKKVNEYITKLGPEINADLNEFAFTIYKLSAGRSAIEYILDNDSEEYQKIVIDDNINDGVLEFGYDYNFSTVPEIINEFKEIKKISLSSSKLKKFPLTITTLSNLEEISFSGMSLRSIPKEIEKLSNLKSLDLLSNSLGKFPEQVCSLEKLEFLNLRYNSSLSSIPTSISKLKNLKHLDVSKTKVVSLPNELAELKNLQVLNIIEDEANSFTDFPEVLTQLKSLEELHISYFQALAYAEKINDIPNLKELKIYYSYGKQKAFEELLENNKWNGIKISSTQNWSV